MAVITDKFIADQIQTGNIKLLGQIEINDEEYAQLIAYIKRAVNNLQPSSTPRMNLTLSLALVQIAIRHYQEGKYWKCFLDEIGQNLPSSKLNYLGQIFARTIRAYGLLELQREENSSQMYVENIKAHAFVTNYYMQGFFDFSYAFFENNLFRELSEELSEDIADLSDFMATTLSSNKDALSSDEPGKKTAKSYKLLKSTRAVFAQCPLQTTYTLFYPILSLIEKYYYDNSIPEIAHNRYEAQFAEWCRDRQITEHAKKVTRITRRLFSHKPYIKMDIKTGNSMLVIPPQKFRNEECDGNAQIEITADGHTVVRQLELYRSFGIYISEELVIPVLDIFDEIFVSINGISEKKYRFIRSNYRIFNSSWESIPKFSRDHNYLLVKKNVSVSWNNESDLIDSTDIYACWQYFSVNVNDNTVCYIGNRPISIIGEFSNEPVFDSIIERFSVYNAEEKKLISTREHPGISFVVPRVKFNGTVILVNGNKYPLKDIMEKSVYEWPEDRNNYAINIVLERILPADDGLYSVVLDIPGESAKKICEYLLLREFKCRLNKPKYIYAKEGTISILKAGHEVYRTSSDWTVDYDSEDSMLFGFPICEEMQYAEFSIALSDDRYTVRIPIYTFRYGFSPVKMTSERPDYIWYGDLGETLYVKLHDATNMFAYWGRDTSVCCRGVPMENDMFRIDISPLLQTVKKEDRRRWQYINLEYVDGVARRIPLPPILRSVVVEPYFKLGYDDTGLYMDLECKGKASLYLDVTDSHTGEKIVSNRELISGRNAFPELTVTGLYNLYPFMEEADEFGFDMERTALKPMFNVGYADLNNLVSCRLPLKEIILDEESLALEYLYFVQTSEKLSEDEYTGSIYRVQMADGKPDWPTKQVFGRVKIHLYQKDEDIKFTLLMYSRDEEDWMPPYYDRDRHFVLGCDNRLVYTVKDYARFIPMEEDYTEYLVDVERMRRFK